MVCGALAGRRPARRARPHPRRELLVARRPRCEPDARQVRGEARSAWLLCACPQPPCLAIFLTPARAGRLGSVRDSPVHHRACCPAAKGRGRLPAGADGSHAMAAVARVIGGIGSPIPGVRLRWPGIPPERCHFAWAGAGDCEASRIGI